jgi:hypothetical protein
MIQQWTALHWQVLLRIIHKKQNQCPQSSRRGKGRHLLKALRSAELLERLMNTNTSGWTDEREATNQQALMPCFRESKQTTLMRKEKNSSA